MTARRGGGDERAGLGVGQKPNQGGGSAPVLSPRSRSAFRDGQLVATRGQDFQAGFRPIL